MSRKYQKHGPMQLTCECFGDPPTVDSEVPKRRQYSSKKCNCPYMFRVYCFEKPTKLIPPESSSKSSGVLLFLPGVYIYEYPSKDHTCNRLLVNEIVSNFESEKLYNNETPSTSLTTVAITNLNSHKFWDHALILYQADVSQDRAFQILEQLGNYIVIL